MRISKPLEKNWPITQHFETKVKYMRSGIHSGIDYACPDGTDLLACFDGMVIKTENILINSGYGRAIWIQSEENPKVVALYGHTSQILATKGTRVTMGTIIAKSGHSGFVFSTHGGNGAHLHFGLLVDNVWADPMLYFEKQTKTINTIAETIKIPVKNKDKPETKKEDWTIYTIKKNDTLYGIAKKTLGDAEKWRLIFDENKDTIENPKRIYPGNKIRIPNK